MTGWIKFAPKKIRPVVLKNITPKFRPLSFLYKN